MQYMLGLGGVLGHDVQNNESIKVVHASDQRKEFPDAKDSAKFPLYFYYK